MKNYLSPFYFIFLVPVLLISCTDFQQSDSGDLSVEQLAKGFTTPPDSIQTAVYWYWVSDNISKEGVIKDLQAMKKAGINRAFIGNIGLDIVPYGDVKMLSDEWWEILHQALKTATELDIEIGIFNSPGWSQSGGPWVEAENAMRYLTSSQTKVTGPATFSAALEKPTDLFQDVKVIAFPAMRFHAQYLKGVDALITSQPEVPNMEFLMDGDPTTSINFAQSEEFIIDIETRETYTARSLSLHYTKEPAYVHIQLQVPNNRGEYVTHKEFDMDRSKFDIEVGFKPFVPFVVSFDEVESSRFRLKFTYMQHEDWKNAAINRNAGLTEIRFSPAVLLENYDEKSLAKMHPTPLPKRKDYLWPQQAEPRDATTIIDPSSVIDLSDKLAEDGTLTWDVPAGDWIILRTGMTPTGVKNGPASPEATGFEVDKLSKEHVEKHFDGHIGEILRRIPEADRKTFKVVVQDSYEKGGQNFTDGFLEEFEQVYGYDPLPYLPTFEGMVVNSQQASDRFLWDLRRLVANKVAYDYVGGFKKVSNEHGLTTWLENYGHWGFPGEFLMYGGQSDEIAGEFWSEGTLGNIENRAATSCGHIYGKTRIWAESHTCRLKSFSRSPIDLKPRGDRFFAEGINSTLLHVYIHQPYEDKNPGLNSWFGNPFNRKNTWFSQLDVFIDYIKRTNFMLQQGLNVADIAYFIGEDTPIMTGVTDPAPPIGYEYDYINAEVIQGAMTVENGLFTLQHGTQYRILVLPKSETMRPELLASIKELVWAGGVILGPAPKRSPSLQNQPQADEQLAAMAKELWGVVDGINVKSRKYGKGMVLNGMDMQEALDLIGVLPDCKLPEDNSIHYGHRNLRNTQIYFLTNQTDQEQSISPEFRVTGLQPELWDATTGDIRNLPAYTQLEQATVVPIKLASYESVFVVFNQASVGSSGSGSENYPTPKMIANLEGPWQVSFDSALRGPGESVVFDKLIDWTTSDDEQIKYYSGTANYEISFDVDALSLEGNTIIDLGALTSMARVKLNGKEVGGVWTQPYTLDISDYVKVGSNVLQIELVNNWMNRLIGDQQLPEDERPTWTVVNPYNAKSELQPSGLFGPVSVSSVKY